MEKIIFVAVAVEERLPKEEGIYHVLKSSTSFASTGYFDGKKFDHVYKNITHWLEQQPREIVLPEWIDVNKELPKAGQAVDLWIVPEDEEKSRRITWTWEKQDTANTKISGCTITHWIPSPTAPK